MNCEGLAVGQIKTLKRGAMREQKINFGSDLNELRSGADDLHWIQLQTKFSS